MILVLSPSKTQEFGGRGCDKFTLPVLFPEALRLVHQLAGYTPDAIAQTMKISPKLASLTWQRFQDFTPMSSLTNAKQAVLAFTGDVYQSLAADSFTMEDLDIAQQRIRILSGLYGALRPLDLIQPYRLDMGTRLATSRGKNLYEFWGSMVTDVLNESLAGSKQPVLVNLASTEYFQVIRTSELLAELVTVEFKEKKENGYKVIGIHAKRARGLMARFIVKNRLTDPSDLRAFDAEGYRFSPESSNPESYVFCRG